MVKTHKTRCRIYCYEKRGTKGFFLAKPVIYGYIGKGGAATKKAEGDFKTPKGLFKIGSGFGTCGRIRTGLDYWRISFKDRWCCDSLSRYYNEHTQKRTLFRCEDMWKYKKEYRLGFVIEYNTDKKPFKGSAIFFHCGNRATSGCIAAKRGDVESIMGWLDKRKTPHILVR